MCKTFILITIFAVGLSASDPPAAPAPAAPAPAAYQDNGNVDRIVKGAISQINLIVRQAEVSITEDLIRTAAHVKKINDEAGISGDIPKVIGKAERSVDKYVQRLQAKVQDTETEINDIVRDTENELEIVTAGLGVDSLLQEVEDKIDICVFRAEERITKLTNDAAATIRRIIRHSERRVRKLHKKAKGKKNVRRLQEKLDEDLLKATRRGEEVIRKATADVDTEVDRTSRKVQGHAVPLTGTVALSGDTLSRRAA